MKFGENISISLLVVLSLLSEAQAKVKLPYIFADHATATLSDTEAVVGCPSVPKPMAVRYGWKPVFTPTLFNREGLPTSPFSMSVTDLAK